MSARKDALETIIRLAAEHNISADEIAAGLSVQRTPDAKKNMLGRLFNYLGGIFIFSGIGLLTSFIWEDIGSAQRVILTLGVGLAAFVMGIAALKDARFEKASTPLFLVSALLQPSGMFVFLNEYMPQAGDAQLAAMAIFFIMSLQQGLIFWKLRRTSLLFFALLFWNGFAGTALDWLDLDGELIGIVLGISMLSTAYGIGKTAHRAITPFWYFSGGAALLVSWWSLFEGTALDITYLGVNAFLIYASIAAASRTLLFVSVLGLISYMSYFAFEYFADVIGWPICLIVLGLLMMGLSAYAVKIGRRMSPSNL